MKTLKYPFIALAALLLQTPLIAAELVGNGDFEAGTAGNQPPSWTVGGGFSSVLLQNTYVSPFTNKYPASTQAVELVDGVNSGGNGLLQDLGLQSGVIQLNFDFYFESSPVSDAQYNIGLFGPNGGVNFQFVLSPASIRLNGTSVPELAIQPSTWYNLSATLNTTTKKYDGVLTPFGGGGTGWSGENMNQNASPLEVRYFNVQSDFTSPGSGPNLVFDNASVQLVPEPSTTALMLFTLLGGVGVARSGFLRSARCKGWGGIAP